MPNYSFIRLAKVKSVGELKRVENHDKRMGKTLNADEQRKEWNIDLLALDREEPEKISVLEWIGLASKEAEPEPPQGKDWVEKAAQLWPLKMRKDAVLAVECMMGFSSPPEGEKQLKAWGLECLRFAQRKWGVGNIIGAELHRDEKTPHVHLVFIPLDRKRGVMVGSDTVGNKKNLSVLQDEFHEAVGKKWGAVRGAEGFKAGISKRHLSARELRAGKRRAELLIDGRKVEELGLMLNENQLLRRDAEGVQKLIENIRTEAERKILEARLAAEKVKAEARGRIDPLDREAVLSRAKAINLEQEREAQEKVAAAAKEQERIEALWKGVPQKVREKLESDPKRKDHSPQILAAIGRSIVSSGGREAPSGPTWQERQRQRDRDRGMGR